MFNLGDISKDESTTKKGRAAGPFPYFEIGDWN
jgi:hypothetical protein